MKRGEYAAASSRVILHCDMDVHAKPVAYAPTDGLSYDPSETKYWEAAALQGEITRTFEICHGCRMCFKYCDTFPTLFDLIDKTHAGDVRQLAVLVHTQHGLHGAS